MVKHVVKGEKWACSTPKAGKNKPVMFTKKTRDIKRFCEINKEKSGILRLPISGLNNTPYIEQPRASAPLGADWSVEITADYQKRGRKSKKKYAIKNIILPLSKRDFYAAIAVFPSFY